MEVHHFPAFMVTSKQSAVMVPLGRVLSGALMILPQICNQFDYGVSCVIFLCFILALIHLFSWLLDLCLFIKFGDICA